MIKNKKIIMTLAMLFFAGTLLFAGGPRRRMLMDPSNPPKPYKEGEVLVKFKRGVSFDAVTQVATQNSLRVKKRFDLFSRMKGSQYAVLRSTAGTEALTLVKVLKANPNVELVSPNYRRELAVTHPNDTYYSQLWGMNNTGQTGGTVDADIDAPEAWDYGTGSSSVIVAVIDTGLDRNHPDLTANVWRNDAEYNGITGVDDDGNGYVDDIYGIDPAGTDGSAADSDPMDGYGHGTHCSGTIGARGNNSLGVVGVNWNVKVMGLKFFDDAGGGGYDDDAIECMEYAVDQKLNHGQNVVAINASWGGTAGSQGDILCDAIEATCSSGIVFCAAAGNGGSDSVGDNNDTTPYYPASYNVPGIIAVMATGNTDTRTSFSNYGHTSVDLAAPGAGILSTVPGIYIPQTGDIFFDNMENGTGNWATGGTNNTWAITTLTETYWGLPYPQSPSPTHFWSDSPGVNYVGNTNSWLAYNTDINLSSYTGQNVYLGIACGWNVGRGDHFYVEISNNSGTSWTAILDLAYDGYIYFWNRFVWLIPESYKTTHFRMRFRLVSNASNNGLGWVIDDVGIGTAITYSYESWDGTSMATPHVAGAVGLMASVFPSETVSQRKKRILDHAEAKASLTGLCVTGARLNLYNSITAAPATPDPNITVTAPNGGESWMVGTTRNITWVTEGTVGNVEVRLSRNNGGTWTTLSASEVNDGSYSWTVTTPTGTNNLIQVRETDGSPTDNSNAVFSIVANAAETVSTPSTPSGTTTATAGVSYTYWTNSSASTWGDPVQYYFDWGDGNNSGWLAVGTRNASHSWSAAGTYNVRAQARCAIHTTIVSAWSTTLTVRIYTPTWAAISSFRACDEESIPTVEWHTTMEMGTVGFHLWRQDRQSGEFLPVTPQFLPSLPGSPQGGVYCLTDPGAYFGEPTLYRLDEVDSLGRTTSHGPFTINFGSAPVFQRPDGDLFRKGGEEPSDIDGFRRFQRRQSDLEEERLKNRRMERLAEASLAASPAKERARITVKGKGLFYVTSGQIAACLGISKTQAASLVSRYGLKLTSLGRNIAWLADGNGAGVFFYNEGTETPYSDRNVFWLEKGSGLAMETFDGGNASPADPGESFQDALHFEENHYALTGIPEGGDIWFWDYVNAGGDARSFPVQVPGVAGTEKATLSVSLQGATDVVAGDDHHAVISLNGREVGEASWDGIKAHTLTVSFDASMLQDGDNTISVSGMLDNGAPYSIFYVDSFDLRYQRLFKAVNNVLICRGDGNSVITVSGLTEPQVMVLDVSRPDRPRQALGVAPDFSGRLTFVPKAADCDYLVIGLNAALRPESVLGDEPADLKGPAHQAEYIVIAPEEFQATAKQLARYRQGRKLKSVVVTLEDIYDAFNYGVPSPWAIRDFLAHAYAKWGGKKVRYAVLAGKGTYDYKDYLGLGDNLVPVIMAETPEGLCASDKAFGDVKGKDGIPEIAVGRLPAVTSAELQVMIDKIKAYEGGTGAWTDQAVMIADNEDSGGDFAQSCDELAAQAPGFQVEKIYLTDSVEDARSRIGAVWNSGMALVGYCGHAGINQLASEDLFDAADAASLRNGAQLPLAMMLTCVAGRFELPGFTCLGEALMLNGNGGMVGGLMPSGAAMNSDSLRLGAEFYKAAYRGKAESAGAALLAAMKKYVQSGGLASLLNVYNWLGDPAISFK